MKKITVILFMLCAAAYGIFAQSGTLKEITGTVELKPAGASAFVPAQAGDEIAQDTIVSTGFKSAAVIQIGSSTISVRPLTRLSLAEIQTTSGAENLNMNLQTGRIKVDVKPPAGTRANFTVHSPSAVASVRGTSFEFDTRSIKVIEGTVSLAGGKGAEMPVPAGGESCIGNEDNAADPAQIAAAAFLPRPIEGADSAGGTLSPPRTTGEFGVGTQY